MIWIMSYTCLFIKEYRSSFFERDSVFAHVLLILDLVFIRSVYIAHVYSIYREQNKSIGMKQLAGPHSTLQLIGLQFEALLLRRMHPMRKHEEWGITNRCSCRLGPILVRRCICRWGSCGSDAAAQLNSMLSAGCIGTESALKGEEFGDVGEKFQGRMMSGLLIL